MEKFFVTFLYSDLESVAEILFGAIDSFSGLIFDATIDSDFDLGFHGYDLFVTCMMVSYSCNPGVLD